MSQSLKLLNEIKDKYSEWLEMSEDPSHFIVGVLANKVVDMQERIDYLTILHEKQALQYYMGSNESTQNIRY